MFDKLMLSIGLLLVSQWIYADALNVQLSNKSARINYASEVFGGEFGPTDLEVGAYFNEDSDRILHVGLLVHNDSLDNPILIGIGTRIYYVDAGNDTGQTSSQGAVLALGGEVKVIPENLGGVGFGVYYFVSPNVTSFMDAENFTEYGLIVDYAITEQATVYAGYRKFELKLDTGNSDIVVESSLIYGVILHF